jgi:hypothetical protein
MLSTRSRDALRGAAVASVPHGLRSLDDPRPGVHHPPAQRGADVPAAGSVVRAEVDRFTRRLCVREFARAAGA